MSGVCRIMRRGEERRSVNRVLVAKIEGNKPVKTDV
jgi:hypothetical protein